MKQYCRYCNNLVTGNGTYCTAKNKEIRDSTAKSVNHCKQFEFNEMDAFFETDGYKPRSPKRSKSKEMIFEQIEMGVKIMAKYIERETLISALESEFEDNENCRLFVSEIPTADVVEVVRCKDCVYIRESEKTNRMFCTYHGDDYEFEVYPHKYCSDGVKAKLKECEGK